MPSLVGEVHHLDPIFVQLAQHSDQIGQQSQRLQLLEQSIQDLHGQLQKVESRIIEDSSKGGGIRRHARHETPAITPESNKTLDTKTADTNTLETKSHHFPETIGSAGNPSIALPKQTTPSQALKSCSSPKGNASDTRNIKSVALSLAATGSEVPSHSNLLTREKAHGRTRLAYKLRESIWDASLLIGTTHFSLGASAITGLCLLLNLTLLLAFISSTSHSLTTAGFDSASRQEFHLWRTTVAHDVSLRNTLTGESLASAVCNKKLSLPYANLQTAMVEALEDYLGDQTAFSSGSLMCSLALCVWYLTLAIEIRDIGGSLHSCLGLPRDGMTSFAQVDGYHVRLISISASRKLFVVMLMVLRVAVVVTLGWLGTTFLLYEISIAEMLLNSVSLELILNLDELIFYALLPKVPQAMINRILPIEFSRTRKGWNTYGEVTVLGLGLVGIFSFIYAYRLAPFVEQLRENLHALCGGVNSSLDFVVAVDSIGIPWAAATPSSSSEDPSYAKNAVAKAQDMGFIQAPLAPSQRSNIGLFMQVASAQTLERYMATSTEFKYPNDWRVIDAQGLADVVGWSEVHVLREEDFGDEVGTVYNQYLQYLLGVPGNVSCAQVPLHRCYTHGSTGDDVVMRKLCPRHCGCDSPTRGTVSSPFAKDANFGFMGCAAWNTKRKAFVQRLGELSCVDTNASDVFIDWLQGIGDAAGSSKGLLADDLRAAFGRGGCPAVTAVDTGAGVGTKRNLCSESSLPAICPVSCGCNPSSAWSHLHAIRHDFCPYRCGIRNRTCLTVPVNHSVPTGSYGPLVGFACALPFKYEGKTYNSCTSTDWSGPWCAVTLSPSEKSSLHWGDCPPGC